MICTGWAFVCSQIDTSKVCLASRSLVAACILMSSCATRARSSLCKDAGRQALRGNTDDGFERMGSGTQCSPLGAAQVSSWSLRWVSFPDCR